MKMCRLLLFLVAAGTLQAASPWRVPVEFSYIEDVGLGNSIYVTGDHPDLGSGDVTKTIKLRFTDGNRWVGQIAIKSGATPVFRYIKRSNSSTAWCNSQNASNLSAPQSVTVPAEIDAPYRGKTIYYFSSWSAANLFYFAGGNWITAPMKQEGSGRFAGEKRYKIANIGEAGENLEFVFNDGSGQWDNPAGGGNYRTNIDVVHVQDGNVFSYQPSSFPSAPEIRTQLINSTADTIPAREIRVYLPRGYTQHTWKRYPVLYFHDGQNVFDPGGSFGSWHADAIATQEISQCRIREAILVGINNTAARIPEYQPPSDSYNGTSGRADKYAAFVIHNVRPYIDNAFRTLNDPASTLTAGSSMGGLVSLYLGRETSVFGKIGVLSPALWTSPNFVALVSNGSKKPLRVYLDMGTAEGPSYWQDALSMCDIHLKQGHVMNGDLLFVAGCGQEHNESAWAARLPGMYQYLLPIRDEPAELTQRENPPRIFINYVDSEDAHFSYASIFGFRYGLERSGDLENWENVSTTPIETHPWSMVSLDDGVAGQHRLFWRLKVETHP